MAKKSRIKIDDISENTVQNLSEDEVKKITGGYSLLDSTSLLRVNKSEALLTDYSLSTDYFFKI